MAFFVVVVVVVVVACFYFEVVLYVCLCVHSFLFLIFSDFFPPSVSVGGKGDEPF